MIKNTRFSFRIGVLLSVVLIVSAAFALMVFPSFAVIPQVELKPDDPVRITRSLEIEPIECIRIEVVGGTTWCDILAGDNPLPYPIQELKGINAFCTDNPMIQNMIVAAQVSKKAVTVRGVKIPKPIDRSWSPEVVAFYEIIEVKVDPSGMMYPP
jgi:hypothetical protein